MTVIFRYKNILQDPKRILTQFIKSTFRSTVFLTICINCALSTPCFLRNMLGIESKWAYYLNGAMAGSMVLIEPAGRRLELALYILPRTIECIWNSLVFNKRIRPIRYGECIYFSLASGILMSLYQTDPQSIHHGYHNFT